MNDVNTTPKNLIQKACEVYPALERYVNHPMMQGDAVAVLLRDMLSPNSFGDYLEPRDAANQLRRISITLSDVAKRISSNLLPGDIVEVFSDPITKNHSEGFAKLIERHKVTDGIWNGMPIETWLVRFDGDKDEGSEVLRSIWNGEAE